MPDMRKLPLICVAFVCAGLIVLISHLYAGFGQAPFGGDCRGCHSGMESGRLGLRDVYKDIAGYKVSHEGVEENCAGCHLLRKGLNAGAVMESEASDYQTNSVFFLSGLSRDRHYELVLRFEDSAGRKAAYSSKFRPYEVAL